MNFRNKHVLITGGASGIGKLMAEMALQRGSVVTIWDINTINLENTIQELKTKGTISGYQVDISNVTEIEIAAKKVKSEIGIVDILINNAGIVVGKYFHEHTLTDIQKTMDINANAPMWITSFFLKDMINQKAGHICNIASAASLLSNPKMSVYVASKWAIAGWSDSLRIELEEQHSGVGVTTVMPFYINTGMFEGVKSPFVPILEPEYVAKRIIEAIENNVISLKLPFITRFLRLTQGILPVRAFDFVIGKGLGIYKTMSEFVGRK